LITFIGLALAVQSSGALLVLFAVFGVSYGYRMRVEERVLLSELGPDYAEYMKRTKRLIPFLIQVGFLARGVGDSVMIRNWKKGGVVLMMFFCQNVPVAVTMSGWRVERISARARLRQQRSWIRRRCRWGQWRQLGRRCRLVGLRGRLVCHRWAGLVGSRWLSERMRRERRRRVGVLTSWLQHRLTCSSRLLRGRRYCSKSRSRRLRKRLLCSGLQSTMRHRRPRSERLLLLGSC